MNFFDPEGMDWVDAVAGWGDAVTFGLGELGRDALGVGDVVDPCSSTYQLRFGAGVATNLAGGGAAVSVARMYGLGRGAANLGRAFGPLKGTVVKVLAGKAPLSALSWWQRQKAAAFYYGVAATTANKFAEQASAFNRARADYLLGKISEVASSLPTFMR